MPLSPHSLPIGSVLLAATLLLGSAGPTKAADITAPGGAQRNDGDRTAHLRASIQDRPAKNVILFIGDGMGDSEITSARNYEYGAAGMLPGIDALPLTGQYTTYALDKKSKLPNYTTDSAASGTAWATGTKTYNGAISVDVNGAPQRTMLQLAKANGLKTGNISTAEIQDATPAVQGANVTFRGCYGPVETAAKCPTNALENGGQGSISEQLLDTRADLTLGGGSISFDQTATGGQWQGKTLLEQARERGYKVISDVTGLDAVSIADQRAPVLGLFSPGTMATRWVGPPAVHDGGSRPPVSCTPNPERPATMPTLAEMTTRSISLLRGSNKGFFLQVEGASIDKQGHAANPCAQIGETVDLDEAVQKAMDFAKTDGNTLVVVTADHGHSSQIVYPNSNTPGLTRTLTTKDGAPMTMAYGTATAGTSQMHTGTQVRIAAYGPGAANVTGLTDQTDLFFTVTDTLNLDRHRGAPTTASTSFPSPPATPSVVNPEDSENREPAGAGASGNHQHMGDGLAFTGAQILFLALAAVGIVIGTLVLWMMRHPRVIRPHKNCPSPGSLDASQRSR